MRITALSPQPRQPDRVGVLVDGELRLTLALDVVQELRLHIGDEVDEALLERAAAADERWRAREAAVSLLGYRARYFQPAAGRFTSEDPSKTAEHAHVFGYVNNDPISFFDPDGRVVRYDRKTNELLREDIEYLHEIRLDQKIQTVIPVQIEGHAEGVERPEP